MPYYSVRITGGRDPESAGREAKEMLRGIDPDFTGHANYFYVHKLYGLQQLEDNLSSYVDDGYSVAVRKITRNEYSWRKRL